MQSPELLRTKGNRSLRQGLDPRLWKSNRSPSYILGHATEWRDRHRNFLRRYRGLPRISRTESSGAGAQNLQHAERAAAGNEDARIRHRRELGIERFYSQHIGSGSAGGLYGSLPPRPTISRHTAPVLVRVGLHKIRQRNPVDALRFDARRSSVSTDRTLALGSHFEHAMRG